MIGSETTLHVKGHALQPHTVIRLTHPEYPTGRYQYTGELVSHTARFYPLDSDGATADVLRLSLSALRTCLETDTLIDQGVQPPAFTGCSPDTPTKLRSRWDRVQDILNTTPRTVKEARHQDPDFPTNNTPLESTSQESETTDDEVAVNIYSVPDDDTATERPQNTSQSSSEDTPEQVPLITSDTQTDDADDSDSLDPLF